MQDKHKFLGAPPHDQRFKVSDLIGFDKLTNIITWIFTFKKLKIISNGFVTFTNKVDFIFFN